ncbi:hypothetical protein WISP_52455 [Willisornis vidua]|uniref:FBX41/ZN365 C2H2-type zinc finger domain-containing protein n=1 Tax=Willisornis vidua TaxID=1566151 RepID=A0ABQ9DJC8_9PASS|nr:hypothetical protein WISP_52455 [Willisornis vidua]
MASLDLPYRCPRCGEHKRFRSLSSLRAHLEYNHTYETLYVLSKTNSICDAARFSCDLVPADELEPASSSSPSPRYVHEIEIPLTEIFTRGKAVAPAAAPPATMDAAYEEGLARLKIRAFEKLEVDKRLEKLTEEVEQKIASQVGRLQVELDRKSSELEKAKQESLRLSREKQELEDRASELSRQVDVSVEMLASLKQDLVQKEQELTRKQQEVLQIDQFLKETAAREANAKVRLQHFIEELLDRADRAEKQLQIISSSCGTTPNGSLGRCGTPGAKAICRPRDRHPGPGVAMHGPYGVSNQRSSSSTGSSTDPVGHEVIWALGAGCRDIISLQVAPLHPCQQPTRFSNRCLQMIGRCWPHLRALGVGGAGCGVQGLASLARNCMRLQVLELDHVAEINQEVAAEVCREGLKGLEMLVLTSTPVTPKALLHFNSVCRNLKSIVVQVGIVDYFKEPHSPEAKKMFEEMVNKLQVFGKAEVMEKEGDVEDSWRNLLCSSVVSMAVLERGWGV